MRRFLLSALAAAPLLGGAAAAHAQALVSVPVPVGAQVVIGPRSQASAPRSMAPKPLGARSTARPAMPPASGELEGPTVLGAMALAAAAAAAVILGGGGGSEGAATGAAAATGAVRTR